jgi:hypothetical protein
MRHQRGLPVACACLIVGLGCARERDVVTDLCASVLSQKRPDARVVEAAPALDRSRIVYELHDARGSIECRVEAPESGGLRLASVALDGEPITAAELTTLNVELFLADLRRSDPAGR